MPMFVIAAKALQEMGNPSVIPEIEKLDAVNDPFFKPLFAEVLTALRKTEPKDQQKNSEGTANQVPEDTARKLADPQH